MIKILIADDHSMIRDGIKAMLKDDPSYKIIGEASNGDEVLRLLNSEKPDVVIMDINMPGKNGIVTTEMVTRQFPDIRIIALSMHDQKEYIRKIVHAGAIGYLFKGARREELIEAINSVAKGKKYFSDEIFSMLLNPDTDKQSDDLLTNREKDILKLIVEEYTNAEIADKLFLSIRTVDTHRRNLLQKLQVKNTAGLVKYALNNNLFEQ